MQVILQSESGNGLKGIFVSEQVLMTALTSKGHSYPSHSLFAPLLLDRNLKAHITRFGNSFFAAVIRLLNQPLINWRCSPIFQSTPLWSLHIVYLHFPWSCNTISLLHYILHSGYFSLCITSCICAWLGCTDVFNQVAAHKQRFLVTRDNDKPKPIKLFHLRILLSMLGGGTCPAGWTSMSQHNIKTENEKKNCGATRKIWGHLWKTKLFVQMKNSSYKLRMREMG